MPNQPTPTVTVIDPQNNPLRLGETQAVRELSLMKEQQERNGRMGKNILVSKSLGSTLKDRMHTGFGALPFSFWPTSPSQFGGYKAIPNLQTLKINNITEFRLGLSISCFTSNMPNFSTLPSSAFSIPYSFILALNNSANLFGFQPIFSYTGQINFDIDGIIFFTNINLNFDLLKPARITERSGTQAETIFISNPSAITEAELNNFLANGATFMYTTSVWINDLTGNNAIFAQNNIALPFSPIYSFATDVSFNYTGVQVVI